MNPHCRKGVGERNNALTGRVRSSQPAIFNFNAYSPAEIQALYYCIVVSDADLSFAVTRVMVGTVFSLGLAIVMIAGAELFTGNNLLVMAWASGKISSTAVLRNWLIVYVGNFAGAAGLARQNSPAPIYRR